MSRNNTDTFLDLLYTEKPSVHRGETEVLRSVRRSESLLTDAAWDAVPWDGYACHGIGRDLADFLNATLQEDWQTLETGAGLSIILYLTQEDCPATVSRMKLILNEILDNLSDLASSFDAVENELLANGVLKSDALDSRFQVHKGLNESHLSRLRMLVAALPD